MNVDIEFRLQAPLTGDSITYEWSTDDINWSGTNVVNVSQFSLIIATGATSGSIYLRALVTCGNTNTTWTKLRYDFNTGDIRTLIDEYACVAAFNNIACPAGVYVSTNTLECDSTTYTIPGGVTTRNRWYYVGKVQDPLDAIVKYAYAGWNTNGDCTTVVLCCDCPAFYSLHLKH
ncbi:MAG: hypothetical protein CM15mV42_0390 [uncultured marine virus]|nr:MAG: hypothetical protein CM15mV42_0390 [uncultured marine virus]